MILWGPQVQEKEDDFGTEISANYAHAEVERLSAVTSGVKDIRLAIEKAREHQAAGLRHHLVC